MKKTLSAIFTTALLVGCVAMEPATDVHLTQAYDHAATMRQLEPGTGTVRMNAFMRQRGGGVVTCAGRKVYLYPSTPYSEERARANYGDFAATSFGRFKKTNFIPKSPEYESAHREATCDSQGNVTFERVAAGRWLILTSVHWEAGGAHQGGFLIGRTQLDSGETTTVVLSH